MLIRCPRGLDRLPRRCPAAMLTHSLPLVRLNAFPSMSRLPSSLRSLTACGVPPRRARVGGTKKKPSTLTSKVLGSGDVLLSRGLSPYYHRGCSVSLPCSEWERVGPLRYCHQSAEPHRHFAAIAVTQTRSRISGDEASDTDALQFDFSKNNQALAIHHQLTC